jgi:hypothetical protein
MIRKSIIAAASIAISSFIFVSASDASGGSRSPSPQSKSARTKSPSPSRSTSPAPQLTNQQAVLLASKGAAAQISRSLKLIDGQIATTTKSLELARKGEQAQRSRGLRARSATADRANLENELQDLQVERTRVRNARNDVRNAIRSATQENWNAYAANARAATRSLKGITAPRATRVTFSALPPSQARAEGAASGARFGSVQRRPLNNGGGSSSGGR